MGFFDSPSLATILKDGPLSPKVAAECLAQVCDAVHYAHEHGVRSGFPYLPKVTDFGLAKQLHGNSELTGSDASAQGTADRSTPIDSSVAA